MDIRHARRIRAFTFTTLFTLAAPAAVHASTLAAFTFDGPGASFSSAPSSLDAALSSALWRDDTNRLSNLAGNPGRALAASGFTGTNALHLVLEQAGGGVFELEHLHFDLRASASGPNAWSLSHAGTLLASGPVTGSFRSFDIALALLMSGPRLVLDLQGSGATAATGTLRLDNVVLEGQLKPVPLPGSLFLFVTPLLGGLLRGLRERFVQGSGSCPVSGHSRQPSSSGKYRPSMIGRRSMAAMMRP